ncbi:MAG: SDR family oxidoreductase [Nanoarchaeota archaeon]
MISGKKVLAYIPARSGSKSIKDKNIADVCGKPLIAYSILAAKESKYVDKIIVSTDSAKYAEIARQWGAEAPFLRPAELATDRAVEMDACQHMIDWVDKNWSRFDIVLKLEPTSPLRTAEDVDKAVEKLVEKEADTVISVAEVRTPPFWMNTIPEDRSMKDFINPDIAKKNRQDLPTYYFLDGLVFVARWDYLKKHKSWFSENSFATITPQERAVDVDGPVDLDLVKISVSKMGGEGGAQIPKTKSVIEELFSLKGKVAIITGAVGLLGAQYAEILSDAGAHVVIADINQEACDKLAQKITKRNNIESLGVEVDISDEGSVKLMLEKVKSKFGKVDILINNAVARPKCYDKPFEEYPVEDWEYVMSVNLRGVFICSKIIGSEMSKQGGGIIVNIGSTYGIVGNDLSIYEGGTENRAFPSAVYSASKGGAISLTKHLATYFAKKGIRVNCLSPGGVESNQSAEFIERYSARTPLGRMAKKDEYRGAILFLCSDASSYMTGANLVVDGGWTAW